MQYPLGATEHKFNRTEPLFLRQLLHANIVLRAVKRGPDKTPQICLTLT